MRDALGRGRVALIGESMTDVNPESALLTSSFRALVMVQDLLAALARISDNHRRWLRFLLSWAAEENESEERREQLLHLLHSRTHASLLPSLRTR